MSSVPNGGFPPIFPKEKTNLLQEGKIKFEEKKLPKINLSNLKKIPITGYN